MQGIILAAGKGTRLVPFTDNFPKGMIKLFDKSLIEIQIDNFKKCGIEDITIVTGYKSEKITFSGISYVKNKNFESTNMNASLFCAKEYLNDLVVISYSDIFYNKNIIEKLIHSNSDVSVATRLNWKQHYVGRDLHPQSEAENVLLQNGKILTIRKNVTTKSSNQEIGEFLGLLKLSKKGCEIFLNEYLKLEQTHQGSFFSSESFKKAYLTDMIQQIINEGYDVEPVIIDENWCEIDTAQDIENVRKKFNEQKNKKQS